MTDPGPHPAVHPRDPLGAHLLASRPARERRAAAAATLVSVAAHAALLGGLAWASAAVGDEADIGNTVEVIELVIPEPAEPQPPPPLPQAPPEVEPPAAPAAEAPKGLQTLAPVDIVPPDIPLPGIGPEIREIDFRGEGVVGGRGDGRAVDGDDVRAAPRFTPMTVAPRLLNREEVERALRAAYPPLLRESGIGGTVVVWVYVDEEGGVARTQVSRGSGRDALDRAALDVAGRMRFQPALNYDRTVGVWVEIPVEFTTR